MAIRDNTDSISINNEPYTAAVTIRASDAGETHVITGWSLSCSGAAAPINITDGSDAILASGPPLLPVNTPWTVTGVRIQNTSGSAIKIGPGVGSGVLWGVVFYKTTVDGSV